MDYTVYEKDNIMRVKQIQFTKGAYYHLYNHSSKGDLLFKDDEDYQKCLDLVRRLVSNEFYEVKAYCLMPNHYHILIHQKTEAEVNLPFFQIWQRYARYFNEKHNCIGSIFRQKLQHIWIKEEQYLLNVAVYIHMNPVIAGLVDRPENWKWSDAGAWLGENGNTSLSAEIGFPEIISPQAYVDVLREAISIKSGCKYFIDD